MGTTNTTKFLLQPNTYTGYSHIRVMCQNDFTKSREDFPTYIPPRFNGGIVLGISNSGASGTVKHIGGTGAPSTSTIPGAVGDIYWRNDGTTGTIAYRATTVTSGIVTAWTGIL
jgi:hypothetical protein